MAGEDVIGEEVLKVHKRKNEGRDRVSRLRVERRFHEAAARVPVRRTQPAVDWATPQSAWTESQG